MLQSLAKKLRVVCGSRERESERVCGGGGREREVRERRERAHTCASAKRQAGKRSFYKKRDRSSIPNKVYLFEFFMR